jgi:hypothetical protein
MSIQMVGLNIQTNSKMRKLIDLDEATFEALSILAIKNKTNLKSYIESILITHAGGASTNVCACDSRCIDTDDVDICGNCGDSSMTWYGNDDDKKWFCFNCKKEAN